MRKGTNGGSPSITSEAIVGYVGTTILQRSQVYTGRSLFDRVRTGNELRARCRGSIPAPYIVAATLDSGKVISSTCSCPYEGVCKHVGALLLAWLQDASSFVEIESLDVLLEKLDKAQLEMVIKRLARRDPSVEAMIAQLAKPPDTPANIKTMRKQLKKLLADAVYQYEIDGILPGEDEYEEYYEYSGSDFEQGAKLEFAFEPFTLRAESLARNGALDQALKVYTEIASQIQEVLSRLAYYEPLCEILQGCVDGIADCVRSAPHTALRKAALDAMVDIHVSDMSEGGYGIGSGLLNTLLELAPADAHPTIAARLRPYLKASNAYQSGFVRTEIETLLGNSMTPEVRIDLLRESGEHRELVGFLLEQGRTSEALAVVKAAPTSYATDFADILVEHGMADEAISLVERAARNEKRNHSLIEWLYQQAKRSNDDAATLRYARTAFEIAPSLEHYRRLRNLRKKSAKWQSEREQIVEGLDRKESAGLLVEIYLLEGDHDAALAAFGVLEQTRSPFVNTREVRDHVAAAIAKSHPHEAIALYQSAAFELIEAQGRQNYVTAVGYLARVKTIYQETDNAAQWNSTLQAIRQRYSNLRALREEMQRAQL